MVQRVIYLLGRNLTLDGMSLVEPEDAFHQDSKTNPLVINICLTLP